ncbi:MAG: hypothetical protein A3J65_04390 [Candidatus Buchananbacteria bacterium RIFCSPHIGHO2_02_FULL_45_11b]|uniref:DUF4956 domain-containing protein n=1 Tax=Candidatus Buchananbacteria bacterium RIFCSPHIGHO2_02_FULL_45_11b TaxID=1797541 RepID=A0A1G1YDB3_9BACT|nr:MAG: hypothetical protein A3J65_04390 [Candidatus Buchananbacteria bacterium RIFCSPHIGHO2_02_FULL_45_11b]
MFENLFNSSQGGSFNNPVLVAANLIAAFLLSLLIAIVYKKTHKGLSYSQTFVLTLIITGMVIAAVMMVIGNNIATAFGVFGAFSLLRFRSAVKDLKDMGFLFLVLAVGMAVGTNNHIIALLTTIIVLSIILILTRINFGSIRKFDYILTFILDTRQAEENSYKSIFLKYLKSNSILNIKTKEDGQVLQLSFSIKFVSESDLEIFINKLENLTGVSEVNLITAKNDIEY